MVGRQGGERAGLRRYAGGEADGLRAVVWWAKEGGWAALFGVDTSGKERHKIDRKFKDKQDIGQREVESEGVEGALGLG